MAQELFNSLGDSIESLTLVPSKGGVFEVSVNDEKVFSKKQSKRFPEVNELFEILETKLR